MSREQESFLRKRTTNPQTAFLKVTEGHPPIQDLHPLNPDVAPLIQDCVTAGIAFIGNRVQHPDIRDIGQSTWWMLNSRTFMVGVPVATHEHEDPEAQFLLNEMANNRVVIAPSHAAIYMPTGFLRDVYERPEVALTTIVETGSQLRDIMHGRLDIDGTDIVERAHAYNAEFVLHMLSKNPDIQLDDAIWTVLHEYPNGIADLDQHLYYPPTTSELLRQVAVEGVSDEDYSKAAKHPTARKLLRAVDQGDYSAVTRFAATLEADLNINPYPSVERILRENRTHAYLVARPVDSAPRDKSVFSASGQSGAYPYWVSVMDDIHSATFI
ncbi:hypothetical protein HYS00_00640, partial [Candidatus Microgenomates bacterium]|nr:hypothetical protein [Candidatus Microgenomates bacterium]